jgi:hypothetical protein
MSAALSEALRYQNLVLPEPIGSDEAVRYIDELRLATDPEARVQTKDGYGVVCEELAAKKFEAARALLPARAALSFPDSVTVDYSAWGVPVYSDDQGRLQQENAYHTYAYAASVLGATSAKKLVSVEPLTSIGDDDLQESVLAQLLLDSYSFELIARASGRSFFAPIRNIGYVSPANALADIQANPNHHIYYDGGREQAGALAMRRRVGVSE